jgi:hypothetical protein
MLFRTRPLRYRGRMLFLLQTVTRKLVQGAEGPVARQQRGYE